MDHRSAHFDPPTISDFDRLVDDALAAIPDPFRQAAREIAIQVTDMPPSHILRDMEITDPMGLTGLYEGIPLTEKSSFDQPTQPDTIWLFRGPILAEWAERDSEPLSNIIANVLVHELAHHFGWSDDDIAAIDEWWL